MSPFCELHNGVHHKHNVGNLSEEATMEACVQDHRRERYFEGIIAQNRVRFEEVQGLMTKHSRLINEIVSDVEVAHKAANELADVAGEVLSCHFFGNQSLVRLLVGDLLLCRRQWKCVFAPLLIVLDSQWGSKCKVREAIERNACGLISGVCVVCQVILEGPCVARPCPRKKWAC